MLILQSSLDAPDSMVAERDREGQQSQDQTVKVQQEGWDHDEEWKWTLWLLQVRHFSSRFKWREKWDYFHAISNMF